MGVKETRLRLREVLQGPGCTPAVPVYDVLTARLAQEAGWGICKLNSTDLKAANYGLPDEVAGLVNMSDYADVIRRISRTVPDIATVIDADDCGGTPETVTRWVHDLEAAGASAIEIEDRGYLPISARDTGKVATFHSIETQVANLKAAVAARNDPSMVIIARTMAFTPFDVDADGIEMPMEERRERIRAYAEAGADAIMILGQPTKYAEMRENIKIVHDVTDLPQMNLRLLPELIQDEEFLDAHNVRVRYLSRSTVFNKVVPFIHELMKTLKEDRTGELAMEDQDNDPSHGYDPEHPERGTYGSLYITTTPHFYHAALEMVKRI